MTQKDEALKMAIEALESCDINDGYNGITQYYNEKLIDPAIQACKAALDAMCADKDKQIAELQEKVQTELKRVNALKSLRESYEKELEHYRNQDYTLSKKRLDIIEQSLNSEREMNETLTNENLELQAQINELREALEDISKLPYTSYKWGTIAAQALAKTTPQCLQEREAKEKWEASLVAECTNPNQ